MTHAMLARKPATTRIAETNATGKTLPNASRVPEPMNGSEHAAGRTPGLSWSLSRVSIGASVQRKCTGEGDCGCNDCHSSAKDSVIRRKLKLSQPGDALEMEADRMAESIVQPVPPQRISAAPGGVQRKVAAPESEDQSLDQEENSGDGLQPDETGRPKRDAAGPTVVSWRRPASQGESLPLKTRAFMEGHFEHDFSRIRVHHDEQSASSASRLQAQAYTVGDDIYFGQGNFQPESMEGKKLLAHELAHVVQQLGGSAIHRKAKKPKCGPSDCGADCAPHQGPVHNPACDNETCAGSGASSATSFIRHLDVNLSTQMVAAEIGDAKHATGVEGPFLSSPNPNKTPTGSHTIGIKCSACHTNQHGNGMGWFTSFANGLEFGFHNSQTVARGVHSHGCVRTPCDRAHWIHDNTSSNVTTVCVHAGGTHGGTGWGCKHPRPTFGEPGSGSQAAPSDTPATPSKSSPPAPAGGKPVS